MSQEDSHEVTCILCGGLADEIETHTKLITEDYIDHLYEEEAQTPDEEQIEYMKELIDELGEGHAHPDCFNHVWENRIEPDDIDLEPINHR